MNYGEPDPRYEAYRSVRSGPRCARPSRALALSRPNTLQLLPERPGRPAKRPPLWRALRQRFLCGDRVRRPASGAMGIHSFQGASVSAVVVIPSRNGDLLDDAFVYEETPDRAVLRVPGSMSGSIVAVDPSAKPNPALERTAGSHSLATAAQRER